VSFGCRDGRVPPGDRDGLFFEKLKVDRALLGVFADNCGVHPDYENNPRVAERDDLRAMLEASYIR
jgi:hypothetical protein